MSNTYPKLHNAMWPGLVGKGPDSEPPIDLDTMLALTVAAEVDGQKFDGVDLFLADPHISIDSTPDDIKALADKIGGMGWQSARWSLRFGVDQPLVRMRQRRNISMPSRKRVASPVSERNWRPTVRRHPHRFFGITGGVGPGSSGESGESCRGIRTSV